MSRWQDNNEDKVADEQRKREKEEKRRLKEEKKRRAEEEVVRAAAEKQRQEALVRKAEDAGENEERVPKRSRRTNDPQAHDDKQPQAQAEVGGERGEESGGRLLRWEIPTWKKCRTREEGYNILNDIDEGQYGQVSRARDMKTGDLVALKLLKISETSHNNAGKPDVQPILITAHREIQILRACSHENIVKMREVVLGRDKPMPYNIFLVLDCEDNDLQVLLSTMTHPFSPSETKNLIHQLLSGVSYLHSHWILHRDLKPGNLLLSNSGVLKIADFGMARYHSAPHVGPSLTDLVVTLWYRAPELLLGETDYGEGVDMWSVGCIFAQLISGACMVEGKNEVDQFTKILQLCGFPSDESWPGWRRLPNAKGFKPPQDPRAYRSVLRAKYGTMVTSAGGDILDGMLAMNPAARMSADQVLRSGYFSEAPRMARPGMIPTFPSNASKERRPRARTPGAPVRGRDGMGADAFRDIDTGSIFAGRDEEAKGGGFQLKLF